MIRSPSGFAQILNLILNTLEYILVDRNAVGFGLGQFLPFVSSCLALWGSSVPALRFGVITFEEEGLERAWRKPIRRVKQKHYSKMLISMFRKKDAGKVALANLAKAGSPSGP